MKRPKNNILFFWYRPGIQKTIGKFWGKITYDLNGLNSNQKSERTKKEVASLDGSR